MKKATKKIRTPKKSLTEHHLTVLGGTKGKDAHLKKISKDKKNRDYYS